MTALELFSYIVLWFFLQVTCFGGVAFYRRWLGYQGLRHRLSGFEMRLPDSTDPVNQPSRAGGCGTRRTPIQEGKVAYFQDAGITSEPGICLLCISKPERDLTLAA